MIDLDGRPADWTTAARPQKEKTMTKWTPDEIDDCPYDEPSMDDEVLCCPDCERPNQFGELCAACRRGLQHDRPRWTPQ